MKKIHLFALMLTGLLIASCGGKKKTEDIIVPKQEVKKPSGPIRMQEYKQTKDIEWLNKNYQVEIIRQADDSLRMVKDEDGQKFVDNRVFLRVYRSDGSVFYKGQFTKSAFDHLLNDDYRQTGIFEGFVFDRVEGTKLFFAASVCHPQTDEYMPFVVTLSNMGQITVSPDSELDTSGSMAPESSEEEEGV